MASAEDVGKKLLGEVEELGLDELMQTLRLEYNTGSPRTYFNFPQWDHMLQKLAEARPHRNDSPPPPPPVIELMSPAPGGGKTHLLYHLSALAVLPRHLHGMQACVIILDTDGEFSVPRLVTQMQYLLQKNEQNTLPQTATGTKKPRNTEDDEISTALNHLHIFRPQSLASTIATLDSLPTYLLNKTRHHSFDHHVAFLAIDSASAFYWQDKVETEDAAFLASTSSTTTNKPPPPPQSAYFHLSTALKQTTKTLTCPAIITTSHRGPSSPHAQRSLRPQLPALQPLLRLIVHRIPVRKFPVGISLEQALREAGERQKAVEEGKFECFVNGWGVDERVLQRLGRGFGFRICDEGVIVEEE